MAEDKQQIPAKYDLNAKWEACLDLTLRRFVHSSAAGAFGGLLLFRTPVTRWASVAFGAGVGLGTAYTECSYKFGSPSKCKGPLQDSHEPSQDSHEPSQDSHEPSQDSHEPSLSSSEVTQMDEQIVKKDQED